MTAATLAASVLLAVCGPLRALHEAPVHDPDCGVNKWAKERFALSRPKLWQWLDSRFSYQNKYRLAVGHPKWVGKLLVGPLVGITDLWHLSQTLGNFFYGLALVYVLLSPPLTSWWLIMTVAWIDDLFFEPAYSALRNYK